MSACTLLTGSATQTMKAKRILAEHSIVAEVTKLSSGRESKGCLYGVIFACIQKGNVVRILKSAQIPFEEYAQ